MRRPGPSPGGRTTAAAARARMPRPAAGSRRPPGAAHRDLAHVLAPAAGGAQPARRAPPCLSALPVTGEAAASPEPSLAPPIPRKFAQFSPADAVSSRLRGVRRVFPTSDSSSGGGGSEGEAGTAPDDGLVILVTALAPADAPTAASILVDAFAGAMRTPAWARGSLGTHIEAYLGDHIRMVPRALLVGARLVPAALAQRAEEEGAEDEGEEGEGAPDSHLAAALSPAEAAFPLIGVGELSFSETTRTRGLTLNPPPEGAYLCNMAVAPPARGRGVGAALLATAEEAAALGGAREVYLHLRERDRAGPGGRLYARAGFVVEARDPALLALVLAQDRRALMRKRLW